MSTGYKQFVMMIVGIVLIAVVGIVTGIATGDFDLASSIANLGIATWLFGLFLYIIFIDSRKRWPGTSSSERAYNVLTFKR